MSLCASGMAFSSIRVADAKSELNLGEERP